MASNAGPLTFLMDDIYMYGNVSLRYVVCVPGMALESEVNGTIVTFWLYGLKLNLFYEFL